MAAAIELFVHLPWQDEGLCQYADPELWFPEKGGLPKLAKRICNGHNGVAPCPVADECLEYALAKGERFGVWGGKSERERRDIAAARRKRNAA